MYGKKLLHKGLLWRVGDGKQICIKKHNWIPETIPGTVCTLVPIQDNQKVSSLLSSEGNSWNEEAVNNIFAEDTAERILRIPLSTEGCSDFASWPFTKTSLYTVRSGYNLTRTLLFWRNRSAANKGSSSELGTIEKLWKNLWRIRCPGRMKIVLWRIAQNCLPTGDQLHIRSIPTRYDCLICCRKETIEHCFLLCHYAKEIWTELKESFDFSLKLRSFVHMRQWLLDWISGASDFHSMVLAVAIWHIWVNRNHIRNGGKVLHPSHVAAKIKAYIDFIQMNDPRSTISTRCEDQKSIKKWSLPPVGSALINVDATIFTQTQRVGVGVVIRDHLGQVLAASSRYVEHIAEPELGEAIAMRHALMFAEEAELQNIVVASDCSNLIGKINSDASDKSHTGAIVFDIKSKAPKFSSCVFIHVNRSCNAAAHVLAKSAEHDAGSCWFNEPPDVIRTIICNEQPLNERRKLPISKKGPNS